MMLLLPNFFSDYYQALFWNKKVKPAIHCTTRRAFNLFWDNACYAFFLKLAGKDNGLCSYIKHLLLLWLFYNKPGVIAG
jgi:hypothetical protein